MQSARRAEWAEYVRSRDFAWRLLSARTDVELSVSAVEPGLDGGAVQRVLDRLENPTIEAYVLTRLFYLAQADFLSFMEYSVEDLLRSAMHSSKSEERVVRGHVKGRVLWPRTKIGHISGRVPVGSYIVQQPSRSFDVPENRLLKLLMTYILDAIDGVERVIGSTAVESRFLRVKHIAESVRKHRRLRDVSDAPRSEILMHKRARRAKQPGYSVASMLTKRFEGALQQQRWEAVLSMVCTGWLEPVSDDDLFELFVLTLVLEILRTEFAFGDPASVSLIRPRGSHVVTRFERQDGVQVSVSFDRSPTFVDPDASEYLAVLSNYVGINAMPRRPDVSIIVRRPKGAQRQLLIECKKSSDDRYQRDSVYKALGYLRDFNSLWKDAPTQHPKVIVAFPEDVVLRTPGIEPDRDLALVCARDSARLTQLMKSALPSL